MGLPAPARTALLAALTSAALGLAFVPTAGAQSAAPAISDEARRHFRAGVAYLQDPDGARYEEAYIEFKAAYAASASPKVLGNVGLCAMKLERDGEAIDAYRRYLAEVPDIDPEERAQIQTDVATLETSVARVTFVVEPDGAKVVDTRIPVQKARVTNVYGPVRGRLELGLRPGHHEVRVELAGQKEQVLELELAPGARESRAVRLVARDEAPVAPPASPVRIDAQPEAAPARSSAWPWVMTGVGGAALVAGVGTGIAALSAKGSLETKCPNRECPADSGFQGDKSTLKTLSTATDVLLIGGGVLAVAGVTWLFLTPSSAPSRAGAAPRVTGGAACAGTGCAGSVQVEF